MIPLPGHSLLSAELIQQRIQELARQIHGHYRHRPLVVVGLMNGSLFFLVDLLRYLPVDTQVECWRVKSYHDTQSTGNLQGLEHCQGDFSGKEVLIVDDIFDTGLTLSKVMALAQQLGARDVQACVLLEKNKSRTTNLKPRWIGFHIENQFVIGYGLDYNGLYRGLREIRTLPTETTL